MSRNIDRFYRKLVREAPDAIIYADAEGVISLWNSGAERLFGFSEAEVIGRPFDIIIPEDLRQRHWAGFAEAMKRGSARYGGGDVFAVRALRKDRSRISVELTLLPFSSRTGKTLGMAAILRDATKRLERMKALRREVAALRSRSRPSALQSVSPK